MRFLKPSGSCSHNRLCRNTRIVFMPIACAQPSSRSMVVASKVSACHISSSLIAVEGRKSEPTGHDCAAYHALACASVHRSCACAWENAATSSAASNTPNQMFLFMLFNVKQPPPLKRAVYDSRLSRKPFDKGGECGINRILCLVVDIGLRSFEFENAVKLILHFIVSIPRFGLVPEKTSVKEEAIDSACDGIRNRPDVGPAARPDLRFERDPRPERVLFVQQD